MPDGFYHVSSSPAGHASAVTPSDSTTFDPPARALYVGGAGTVKIDTPAGDAVSFVGLAAGTTLSVQATKVYATGTNATNIVRLW